MAHWLVAKKDFEWEMRLGVEKVHVWVRGWAVARVRVLEMQSGHNKCRQLLHC